MKGGLRYASIAGAAVAVLLIAGLTGCTVSATVGPTPETTKTPTPQPRSARQVADEAVAALKAKDGARFAAVVHPEKGVRFSAYAYVDLENDVVLSRAEAAAFWRDKRVYEWGFTDGKGDPIHLTPGGYCERYIMDRDFASASSVNENNDRAIGNTVNNAAEAYPGGTRIEYYIEPDASNDETEMEWRALRLVLEKSDGTWYVVGVIHDEWTI